MNSVCEYFANFSKTQPNKVALIEKEKELTYQELYELMRGFCAYLKSKNIRKGDIVVCRASATIDYWVAFLGTLLAGGVFVPLEKDCTQEKIESIIGSFNGVFALISSEIDRQSAFKCKVFVDMKTVADIAKQNDSADVEYEFPAYEDDAVILFTTGTTGTSKGVIGQHKYLIESVFRSSQICYRNGTRIIMPVPMNHLFGIGRSMTILLYGGTVILLDGLTELKQFFYALSELEANALALAPSAINYIITLVGEEIAEYFKNIEFIEIGGEKMPYQLQKTLIDLLPQVRMYIVYASTETCVSCIYEFSKYGATGNRIGTPIDKTEIVTVDDDDNEFTATIENPGFLAVKSDCMMKCYWNDARATDKIKKGNMIVMSDYGYIDEEGFVCLLGRKGDVIICGGQKVNPTEVEDCALKSGMIADCVCFGVKDEIFGSRVSLVVVMKEGIAYDEGKMQEYLTDNLEYFKVPKVIACADKIQRNKNGKIDRKYYTKQ